MAKSERIVPSFAEPRVKGWSLADRVGDRECCKSQGASPGEGMRLDGMGRGWIEDGCGFAIHHANHPPVVGAGVACHGACGFCRWGGERGLRSRVRVSAGGIQRPFGARNFPGRVQGMKTVALSPGASWGCVVRDGANVSGMGSVRRGCVVISACVVIPRSVPWTRIVRLAGAARLIHAWRGRGSACLMGSVVR